MEFNLDNTVSVLLGNGDGTFQAQRTYAVGSGPEGIAVGDFNGDGHLDLAVTNSNGNTVSVLMGNGDGTFQPQRTYTVGTSPLAIAVGDFNGDGHPDLAVAADDGTLTILLGAGDGTFPIAHTYQVGGNSATSVAVGDFNGDGHQDLAVTDEGTNAVEVFLGNGDGTFAPPVAYADGNAGEFVTAADLNGDGHLDLAVTNYFDNTVSVLLGNGDGTFQPPQTTNVGTEPAGIVAADFTGNGHPDLAVANSRDSTISVLTNTDGDLRITTPADVTAPATSAAGAPVSFPTPTATDESGESSTVNCAPASGSTFAVGATSVTCTATDADDTPSQITGTFTVTVTDPTTTALSSSLNPSVTGQTVTYRTKITALDGRSATGTVSFKDGGTAISGCGSVAVSGGSASCVVTYAGTAGSPHAISATYGGNNSAFFQPSTSSTLSQVVNRAPTKTVAATASGLLSVVFSAKLTRVFDSSPLAAKVVVFSAGGKTLCQAVTNKSGTATCSVGRLAIPLGATTYTATFAGDSNYLASNGSAKIVL